MAKYVRKPTFVEAVLFEKGMEVGYGEHKGKQNIPYITTLENNKTFGEFGEHYMVTASLGDSWLVRKDKFEETYELV